MLEVRLVRRIHAGLTLDVTLRASAREIGVVFGPSGAGKTTLLRLIAGLDSARLRERPAGRDGPLRLGQVGSTGRFAVAGSA